MGIDEQVYDWFHKNSRSMWWGPGRTHEDIASECYIKWKKASIRDPKTYGHPSNGQLRRIMSNHVIDVLRIDSKLEGNISIEGSEVSISSQGGIPSPDYLDIDLSDPMILANYMLNVYGSDIADVAKRLRLTPQALRLKLKEWKQR